MHLYYTFFPSPAKLLLATAPAIGRPSTTGGEGNEGVNEVEECRIYDELDELYDGTCEGGTALTNQGTCDTACYRVILCMLIAYAYYIHAYYI